MTASAQICPDSGPLFPKKVASVSGHYEYKSWAQDSKGERVARKFAGKEARYNADLAANSYRNANGLETVFGIVFDFDAHRAKDCWKDAEGKLNWELIFPALKKEIPEVANLICYAVRSTGGKGLGVVMAISPLPMLPSTAANQQSALKLQGRILSVFDKMGLGADFGARGVSRDLPNFNNPDRLVYRNTQPLRELEKSSRPVVTELHKLLNARDRAARFSERIYNDERVEKGLAKLVLWLLGAVNFDQVWKFEGETFDRRFKNVPYLSGWSVSATMRELCALTGLSDAFLRKFLKSPPKWLKSDRCEGEGWSLCLPLSKDVPWLQERSFYLLQKTQELSGKVSFDPQEICLPWWVQDGERNAWIVRLALIYKWAGYSLECAIEKVLLRIQAIPGSETSRNCKNVCSIVRSLFRRTPESLGALDWKDLPDWIKDDKIFCSLLKRTNTRRGITPGAELSLVSLPQAFPSVSLSSSSSQTIESSVSQTLRELQKSCEDVSLVAVRRKQRIGIFHGDKLLLCLTKKHYKATQALEYLQKQNAEFQNVNLRLISPRKSKQENYFEAVDNADFVQSGEQVCGRKKTLNEAIENWKQRNGILYVEPLVACESVEEEIPF